MRFTASLERLEARIAPAALVNPTTVTYTDADGDVVTVKTTKGVFADPNDGNQMMWTFDSTPTGVGQGLTLLNLDGLKTFEGANLTVTAKPSSSGGDGVVAVGAISAIGVDLGVLKVGGDLGQIDCGDSDAVPGLKTLSLGSLGADLLFSETSTIQGPVGSIKIGGDVYRSSLEVQGTAANGGIGSLFVGGSIIGGFLDGEGSIRASGKIGSAVIGGDLSGDAGGSAVIQADAIGSLVIGGSIIGGYGEASGAVVVTHSLTKISVGGSLLGGYAGASGSISAATIGTATIVGSVSARGSDAAASASVIATVGGIQSLTIGGSVIGDSSLSGLVGAKTDIATLTIGGSIVGGSNNNSGGVTVGGTIGTLTIRGSVVGGDNFSDTDPLFNTGFVFANRITTMVISGSITAGDDVGGGGVSNTGVVRAKIDIGSLAIHGSLVGSGDADVIISAGGHAADSGGPDMAIRSLVVGGNVRSSEILAGYVADSGSLPLGKAADADASIGSVKVGGDWQASDLIAGISPGTDTFFGDENDVKLSGTGVRDTAGLSQIASVTIGGRVLGTTSSFDASHNGFGAEILGIFKIGGLPLPAFINGAHTDTFAAGKARPIGSTQQTTMTSVDFDVHAFEV